MEINCVCANTGRTHDAIKSSEVSKRACAGFFLLHWEGLFTCAGVIHLRPVHRADCPLSAAAMLVLWNVCSQP